MKVIAPEKRRPGRPKGTTYAEVDAHVHDMMRLLIVGRRVPSLTEAARRLVHLSYGGGSADSKVRRLVRTYPYNCEPHNRVPTLSATVDLFRVADIDAPPHGE